MRATKTVKIDFLDIIFDGRNKEYGAYDLRKTYKQKEFQSFLLLPR